MKKQYSELLEEFLNNEDFKYHVNDEKSNFILDIQGSNGSWKNSLFIDNKIIF